MPATPILFEFELGAVAPPTPFEQSISADTMLAAPALAASGAVSFAKAIADPMVQIAAQPPVEN